MSQEEIIVGLDIGSTSIKVAVGQRTLSEDNKQKLHIIGAVEHEAEGINRGVITSIEDAVESVAKALDKAEKLTGIPIEQAWVSISGGHIISQVSKGVEAVSKTDGEIREEDVERAIEAARTETCPPNYEILHVIPRSFTVDGQTNIKDPIGMTGVRLEVETYIIEGLSSQIKNLTKCVYQTGLDIDEQGLYEIGERVFNQQRAILVREGQRGREYDKIGEFNYTIPLKGDFGNPECIVPGPDGETFPRKGLVLDKNDFEKMKDEYYRLRGWDVATGLQTRKKLEMLNLKDVADQLEKEGVLAG